MDDTPADRRDLGLATARAFAGDELADGYLARLGQLSPDLADALLTNVYSDVLSRSGLTPRDRELLTLATLIALGGCNDHLRIHVELALNVGTDPQEILETLLQAAAYAGFPRALAAAAIVHDAFAARGLLRGREH
ncbi:carboxymuconolactone decarboxylase family protein [Streptomyces argenteolus]|uniref:Carboxymuconolactone decarboxylase family protein n=1 Tax=Streptomyces argenteolus TaxID=67274 RepID=A0ABW6XEJ4_9ACTN